MWKKVGLVLLVLAVALAGCATKPAKPTSPTTATTATTAAVSKQKTLWFGVPISLSGKFAYEGQMSLWGMKAAVKWINEHGGVKVGNTVYKVALKVYDDNSKKEMVQSLIARLATVDHIKFILAPYSSGLTLAAAPIAEKYHVLLNSHGGASDYIFQQGYYYIVQTLSPASQYMLGFLEMIHKLHPNAKRLAIVYADSEFARTVIAYAKDYAKKLGFQIVFDRAYPPGITDMSPILNAMKATKPDILIGGGHFEDGALLVKQLSSLNINLKAICILVAPALPQFYTTLGNKAEGICAPAQWEVGVAYSPALAKKMNLPWYGPTNAEFIKLFKEVVGKNITPDYHAAEAAAAVLSYAYAIQKAQSLDPTQVRKTMGHLEFMTFFGVWKIDPKTGKQIGHKMVVIQWQNGQKKIVWPPEAANSKLCYPLPTWNAKAQGAKCTV